MRIFRPITCLLPIFLSIALCSQEDLNLESYLANAGKSDNFKTTKVVGSLLNYSPELYDEIVIKYILSIPELKNESVHKADLKEDGTFEIIVENALPYQQIWLNIGEYYSGKLILNSELSIEADLKILSKKPVNLIGKGVQFGNTDGELTSYVNEYGKFSVSKKVKLNREKFTILMNRIAQPPYKEKLVREHYEALTKIENDYARKKGKTYRWFLENERLSDMHTDLMSIHLGREIDKKIWETALTHCPKTMTSSTNQFYDMMSFFVSNPTENQTRKLRKKIYLGDSESREEVDELNDFLKELDKKNAGLLYDNELYAKGLDKYVKKYDSLLIQAQFEDMLTKLESLPLNKRGLNLLKLLPQNLHEREKFILGITPLMEGSWYEELILRELTKEKERRRDLSELFGSINDPEIDTKLGRDRMPLASGAGMFIADAKDARSLLRNIRRTFGARGLVIGIWTTESTTSLDEMKRSLAMIDRLNDISVDVVYLCTDENTDVETWKKTLAKLYIGGEHIFLDQALSIDLLELLDLSTYPIYLFIDKQGMYDPDFITDFPSINIPELKKRLD